MTRKTSFAIVCRDRRKTGLSCLPRKTFLPASANFILLYPGKRDIIPNLEGKTLNKELANKLFGDIYK
jgi:hypothetical protein